MDLKQKMMNDEKLSEFVVHILKQYAKERGLPVRSTSDLSPLEEYLLIELYKQCYGVNNE